MHPAGIMYHKAIVAVFIVLTRPGTNGLFVNYKRSNDAFLHHARAQVNIWRVPPIFYNLLGWLSSPNFAVISVHDTIQMEYCANRKDTKSRRISSLLIFCIISSQRLFQNSRSAGLVSCRNCNLCARRSKYCVCRHELCSGWHAVACVQCGRTCTRYVATFA
jgi:hypothetical protein